MGFNARHPSVLALGKALEQALYIRVVMLAEVFQNLRIGTSRRSRRTVGVLKPVQCAQQGGYRKLARLASLDAQSSGGGLADLHPGSFGGA